jgi:glutamate formiminotransferase/formiminotetrahydrofolate cyclodeaminase
MNSAPVLECVPNFSEGVDVSIIRSIADSVRRVAGAHLLHTDTSPAANRTVLTFAGAPEAVVEAAFQAIGRAAELIDMSKQAGVHPRIGATDVCPLIPLAGMTMPHADEYAHRLGERVGRELNIPVYLYEYSSKASHRRALPDIRKGQYEGFAEKMLLPDWAPDFGPKTFTPRSGATVIGARDLLVAFNISLNTDDVNIANQIAALLRASGYLKGGMRIPGLLPKVRAIGWFMADYNQAQVSFNLLDYRITSPLQAFEACKEAARELGVSIAGSEVIGLIPEACLLEAGVFATRSRGEVPIMEKEMLVHEAIQHLGLGRLKPFLPHEKILEWALADVGLYL